MDAFLFKFSKRLCLRNQTVVTVIDNYLSPDVNTAIFQIVLQPESRKVYCKNSNYSKLGAISADFHRLASRHKADAPEATQILEEHARRKSSSCFANRLQQTLRQVRCSTPHYKSATCTDA